MNQSNPYLSEHKVDLQQHAPVSFAEKPAPDQEPTYQPDLVLSALCASESATIARMSVVLLLVVAVLFLWFLKEKPSLEFGSRALLVLFGVGGLVLAIRRPWLDKRRRQSECRTLLDQLAESSIASEPVSTDALNTLRVLALPTSGEPRETRRLAGSLYLRLKKTGGKSLPIPAKSVTNSTRELPVSTGLPTE